MEITSRLPDRENPSSMSCPNSNGAHSQTPPLTPKPVSRSETSPYPTTFIQADATSFKQVVQMLTGSAETAKQASNPPPPPPPPSKGYIPPIKTGQKKQNFKLYERRNNLKNGLMISLLIPGVSQNSGFSPRKPEILSPSLLDFPSLVLSPVTPLTEDTFNKASSPVGSSSEEEKAIAEKGFYLHPSPRTTPGAAEPRLLPLFPVTSPRVSESSS